MSHQEKNFEKPEEELEPSSTPFEIPLIFKWCVTIAALFLITLCALYVNKYLCCPKVYASPSDLGLTPIFLFSISSLFIIWMPWQKLGIRITKIGVIEFGKIVAEQASEHAGEISYLQDRIEALEVAVHKNDKLGELTKCYKEPKLQKLLLDFLTKYKEWAFSPSRIRVWGSQQQGFSELENYEHHFIRSTLQKMVSDNILETRISKNGNTLYRIPIY